ncbi:MAG: endolytic transglycosylase MltG [Clostridia bacterium]|nr:endolytic transglycosylase MltG [Clostridia bacterium]
MNEQQNNPNKKQPFKVHIDDDSYMSPSDLDNLVPPARPQQKKFEVHIDDYEAPAQNFPEQQPIYKGEIYFSNSRPPRQQQTPVYQQQPPAVNNGEINKNKAKKKKKARRRAKGGFFLFCVFVILFTAAFSAFGISCINDVVPITLKPSIETYKVEIPQNATTDEVIDILKDNDLINQGTFCKVFFKIAAILTDPSEDYLSGIYYLQKNMGLENYLYLFTGKSSSHEADTVTLVFPEGWTIYQIVDKIDEFNVCDKDQLLAAIKGTNYEYSFIDEIGNVSGRTLKLEGYFYPDTYEFYEKSDANTVVRTFLNGFDNKWTDEYEERAKELGLTRDEILTIASIIQREAASKEQMYLISSVLHNRLNNSSTFPLLQCDSTLNYVNSYVSPNVSTSETYSYSQNYNTYSSEGLPPGPICNPGEDAIEAALYPDETDYYYFRHDKYGKIYMGKTQQEHDENGILVLKANSY